MFREAGLIIIRFVPVTGLIYEVIHLVAVSVMSAAWLIMISLLERD